MVIATGDLPGDFANSSCGANKTFPGDVPYVETTCQDNGKWSTEIPECIGNHICILCSFSLHIFLPVP